MLRIHFTASELAQSRMVAGLGPMVEGAFALHLFAHSGDAVLRPWRHRVRAELDLYVDELEALAERTRNPHALLAALGQCVGHEPQEDTTVNRSLLAAFVRVAVMPYWSGVKSELEKVREVRARIVITNGIERLLDNLHPKLHWHNSVLEIHDGPDRDIHLDGRGLVLSPSFFLGGQSCVFIDRERESGGPVLSFPTSTERRRDTWFGLVEPDDSALGALVGHTRAAALQALTDSCSTGELADRLGISLAGASKHAAVLRRAGLITTSRNRNKAIHILTSLGMALLQRHRQEASFAVPPTLRPGAPAGRVRIPVQGGVS
ncbi:ArsR family transcriptional regulator [Streptomyces albidoflavus]|uniref:ArsR/SmtB family transcription factor n=2 Tax=Streptomyces TaxID=1883 RepID=UPI00081B6D40|nr:ArsR family transcriptional regulator [Streptomyces albidoflavus]RZE43555.1 ArsR family transcriptional regulator [Streptomyces albidoflavus]SCD73006.1 Helix-turn-helix domain-containing protein [Streptomyces sp. BvitLS-983]